MSAPRFAVETVLSGVGILAESNILGEKIASALSTHSLEPTLLSLADPASSLSNDIEQYLIFLTPKLGDYLFKEGRGLLSQIASTNQKIFVVQSYASQIPLALPDNSYKITLGEYLGLDNQGAPFLSQLLHSLTTSKRLVLSGTGIEPYALMSEAYVLSALAAILTSSHTTNTFFLHNPDTISVSSLSHHLVADLPYSVTISYGDGLTAPPLSRSTTVAGLEEESTLSLASLYFTTLRKVPEPLPIESEQELLEVIPKKSESEVVPKMSLEKSNVTATTPEAKPSLPPFHSPTPPRQLAEHLSVLKSPRKPLTSLEFVPTSPNQNFGARRSLVNSLRGRGLRIVVRGLLVAAILYLGSIALSAGISYLTVNKLKSELAAGNYSGLSVSRPAILAGKYLEANSSVFGLKEPTLLLNAYNQSLILSSTLSELDGNLRAIANYVFTDSGDNIASNISSARLLSEDLYQQVALLDGTLPQETPSLLLSKYDSLYQKLKSNLVGIKKNILIGKAALSIMPDFLGLGGRAKYAILFQNNMELRATGGFIGSFALMSFENGKLYDLPLYDVYSADGQLKGHIDPPTPIKDILGEANWYLRDSNFDPDFPTSARRAEWFIKKTMNQDVEGTIGVNLETLKALLLATGPLELPDYGETVNAGNLYERAQFHAEVNFFPGSTAKKEFLSAVSDALFNKLKGGSSGVLVKALLALSESLEQNNLEISSLNANTEHVLQTLGWNGEVASKPCATTPCYEDYFYQVDSNFGVNKANFYISRATNLDLIVGKDGSLSHIAKITWENKATSNAWPAGTYKNYARTYLPTHVSIQSIQVGDKVLSSKDYTTAVEHDKLVIGYLVSVPVGEKTTVTISYQSSTPLISGTHYTLYHQKQSGIKDSDSVKVSLAYPLFYKPTQISPAATILPQQLVFDFVSDADRRVSVQF